MRIADDRAEMRAITQAGNFMNYDDLGYELRILGAPQYTIRGIRSAAFPGEVAAGRMPSVRVIRVRLHVGQPRPGTPRQRCSAWAFGLPPIITQAQDALSIEVPAPRLPLTGRALSVGRVP